MYYKPLDTRPIRDYLYDDTTFSKGFQSLSVDQTLLKATKQRKIKIFYSHTQMKIRKAHFRHCHYRNKRLIQNISSQTLKGKALQNRKQSKNNCYAAAHPFELGIRTTSSFHRGGGDFANRHGRKQCQWQRKADVFHIEEGKTNTRTPSSAHPLPWQRPRSAVSVNSSSIPGPQKPLEGIQSYIYMSWLSLFSWCKPDYVLITCLVSWISACPFSSLFCFFSSSTDQDPEGRVKCSNNTTLTPEQTLDKTHSWHSHYWQVSSS